MLIDKRPNPVDLLSAETMAPLQPNRVEPEFRLAIVALDVNMRRLAAVPSVEEEPERPATEDSWHAAMLRRAILGGKLAAGIVHRNRVKMMYQSAPTTTL